MDVGGVGDVVYVVEEEVVPVDTVHGGFEVDALNHGHLLGVAKLIDHRKGADETNVIVVVAGSVDGLEHGGDVDLGAFADHGVGEVVVDGPLDEDFTVVEGSGGEAGQVTVAVAESGGDEIGDAWCGCR